MKVIEFICSSSSGGRRGDRIPGLVYQGSQDIKLGLGDFIFYSILVRITPEHALRLSSPHSCKLSSGQVGRASMHGATPMISCAVAVLAELCACLLVPVLAQVMAQVMAKVTPQKRGGGARAEQPDDG